MLQDSRVAANIPAADLDRARRFYEESLGLTPTDRNDGGLVYETAGTSFHIYETEHAGRSGHTIAQFHVADVVAEVRELKAKGVAFEHYDMPGLDWDGDVASIAGMGHAAWFKDSENNILCLDDALPG